MHNAYLFIVTKDCHLFKKGQKVWSDHADICPGMHIGQLVVGRYQGKGRWIVAYFDDLDSKGASLVSDDFAIYIRKVSRDRIRFEPRLSVSQLRKIPYLRN